MVGDVKQSIYKFRQESTLFMDKYHRFTKMAINQDYVSIYLKFPFT